MQLLIAVVIALTPALYEVQQPIDAADLLETTLEAAVEPLYPALLDSCQQRISDLQVKLQLGTEAVERSEIDGLAELLVSLEPPPDSPEERRIDDLSQRVRDLYTLYLVRLDELPADVAPDLILEEPDITNSPDDPAGGDDFGGIDYSDLESAPEGEAGLLPSVGREPLPEVPLVLNKKVERAIKYYTTKGRRVMQLWFERSAKMIPVILPILREEGLPRELVYLAMIESGFNTRAYSWAHAAGPWQFIAGTARKYGLEVNWWYDERRDPEKSTRAAAAYLRTLYGMFDDWYLTMAAYNCGENKVLRHRRIYGDDFWNMKRLPRQTRNYIPSFIAAVYIAMDPQRFGFNVPDFRKPPQFETVTVTECVDLGALAEASGVELAELRGLNPALVRWCTPPGRDSTVVRLPKGAIEGGFWERYDAIPESKKVSYVRHRVRSGETLSTIARRYGVPMYLIANHPRNRIRNRHRIRAGQVLIIPGVKPGSRAAAYVRSEPVDLIPGGIHKVRRGETLSGIAMRYGVKVSQLRRWNRIRGSLIRPGQRLKVRGSYQPDTAVAKVKPGQEYIVVPGDSLWSIARRHGVSVRALKRINGLGRNNLIRPGDRLRIPEID